jgi:hypothetical protein
MQSQLEKNQLLRITAQIDLLERMKDIYVRTPGHDKFKEWIVSLMNQMPGMGENIAGDLTNLTGTLIGPSPATTAQETNTTDCTNQSPLES